MSVLRAGAVEALVDVRRYPGSRRHPQFAREALSNTLREARIDYLWRGDTLGGRRTRGAGSRHTAWRNDAFAGYADHMDTAEFRAAFEVLAAVAQEQPTAVMCAETVWWRCHRRLIADAFVLRDWEVIHLLDVDKTQRHTLHEAARDDGSGFPVYDLGTQGELL